MAHQLLWRLPAPFFSRTVFALGALIALWGSGACLYSDPINVPPTVNIINPGPVPRKQKVTFRASTSDDVVTLEWKQVGCVIPSGATASDCKPCPFPLNVNANMDLWPKDRVPGDEFTVVDTDLPSCIWAIATDRYQAMAATTFALYPENHSPTAEISLLNPVFATGTQTLRLHHEIELSAELKDADGDPLTNLLWQLVRAPNNSKVMDDTLGTCSNSQPSISWCLTPDLPGDYVVELTVNDGYGDVTSQSTITRTITVATDQFPCLTLYDPMSAITVYDQNRSNQLSITGVDDDEDASAWHYRWFTGLSEDALQIIDNDVPQFTPSPYYAPGDVLVVRVEIFDQNVMALEEYERSCGNQDTCSQPLGQTVCNQRWTWRVRY